MISGEDSKYDNDIIKKHEKVLSETKHVANAFIISSSIGFFSESMMLTVWILYAKTFDDCTDNLIIILVFLLSIFQMIGIILTSILSDKYGFDMLTIITSTILLISVLFLSISYSIVLFGVGICLKGLVMDDIEVLSLGFTSKLLPYNTSAMYTGYWYTWSTVTYLFGFIVGGILSAYTQLSYRMVFIVSTINILIRWMYVLLTIRNTEKNLIDKQMVFVKYYQKQLNYTGNIQSDHGIDVNEKTHLLNNYNEQHSERNIIGSASSNSEMSDIEKIWFPLCLEQIREDSNNNKTNDGVNNSNIIWIELILNIFQFAFSSIFTVTMFQFVVEYMLNRFNLSEVIITSQLSLCVLMFAITTTLISVYLPENDYFGSSLLRKYILLIPFYIITIIVLVICIPLTTRTYVHLLWFWWCLLGISLGFLYVITELCVLELQPKRHTGKVNGIKTAARYFISAIVAAIIAYLWNYGKQHIWFLYCQGIVYFMAFIVNICLISIKLFSNQKIQILG